MNTQKQMSRRVSAKLAQWFIVGLSLHVGAAAWGEEPILTVGLHATQTEFARLGPDIQSGSESFQVDEAQRVAFTITSSVDGLVTSLIGPGDQLIDPGTIGAFGGFFVECDGPEEPEELRVTVCSAPGFHYVYDLPLAGTGTYTVQFQAPSPLAQNELVMIHVLTDAVVRTNLIVTEVTVVLGTSAVLGAIIYEGSDPVTNATVEVTVLPPTGAPSTMSLLDDGIDVDIAVGDGLYSGSLELAQVGEYTFVAEITGVNSHGTNFRRQNGAGILVVEPCATLTGTLTDCGVDDDENGLYDRIVIEAGVDVSEQSEIGLFVTLETLSGQTLLGQGQAELPAGPDITYL